MHAYGLTHLSLSAFSFVLSSHYKKDDRLFGSPQLEQCAKRANSNLACSYWRRPSPSSPWWSDHLATVGYCLFPYLLSICFYLFLFTACENIASNMIVALNLFTLMFSSLDLVVLTDVQNELRLVGQKTPISTAPLSSRFWWALRLLQSPRGIGWAHEPTAHIRPRPTTSRAQFLLDQLLRTAKYILIFDVTRVLSYSNPYFQKGGLSLTDAGWLWRSTMLAHVVTTYIFLSLIHIVGSTVSVALGLTAPGNWPHFFGYIEDAYTVGRSWG